MKDGRIDLDSDSAKEFGFTSDKFGGYLWKKEDTITISFIISYQLEKGNFSKLLKTIGKNFSIEIPTPSVRMKAILEKKGFIEKVVFDEDQNAEVELMVKEKY